MAKHLSTLNTITVLTLFGVASFACAEVVRCEGGADVVIYTNTDCGDAQPVQVLLVEKPLAKNVTYQQPSQPAQTRSNWANINITPRKAKVDVESVRSARLKIISMDKPLQQFDTRK